jgi:DnaJ-class molecular chaperone
MSEKKRKQYICPCCKGAKRLTLIEHDDESGRTFVTKPLCNHCGGEGTVTDEYSGEPLRQSEPPEMSEDK